MAGILREKLFKGRKALRCFSDATLAKSEGVYALSLRMDEGKKQDCIRKHFGKKLTFTNHRDQDMKTILRERGLKLTKAAMHNPPWGTTQKGLGKPINKGFPSLSLS